MDRIRIVLGLGNPGLRYRNTRHNLGFRVLDEFARQEKLRFRAAGELGRKALTTQLVTAAGTVLLAKPRTYMNRSGRAATALLRRRTISPAEMLVVYDDADLELGAIRLRTGGGTGGHNGIRSLIDSLRSADFPRIRLGVKGTGRAEQDLADYVLTNFAKEERQTARALVELGVDALRSTLDEGLQAAMNRFNGRSAGGSDTESGTGV